MTDLYKDLFYKHYPSVVRKLNQLVRDESAAEDLAQEVFLKLYKNPPDELAAVGAWLHRVLTRVGYDYLNRKTRERQLQQKQEHIERMSGAIGAASNEEVMIRKLERMEVQQMLQQLPERDRQLLLLKYSGYSYNEIAEQLDLRQPVVGTLLHRATVKFRKHAEQRLHNP